MNEWVSLGVSSSKSMLFPPPNSVYKFSLCYPFWLKTSVTKTLFAMVKYESKWHHIAFLFFFFIVHVHWGQGSRSARIESLAEVGILMSLDFCSCRERIIPFLQIHLWDSGLHTTLVPGWIDWPHLSTGRTPFVGSSLKSRARLGDSEDPRDPVCQEVPFLLTMLWHQALSSLTSDGPSQPSFLLLAPPGDRYSVLPAAPPSFTSSPFSLSFAELPTPSPSPPVVPVLSLFSLPAPHSPPCTVGTKLRQITRQGKRCGVS